MNIAIRVDASLEIGAGHVMRCLTFAESLRARGIDVVFLCRPHPGNLVAAIEKKSFPVRRLQVCDDAIEGMLAHAHWLGTSQEEDARQCIEVLGQDTPDWIIVDHYALDATWEVSMKSICGHVMVIDDLGDRDHWCDVLLDQNYGSTPQKYQRRVPVHCLLLLGSDYALLRAEFLEWRDYSLKRREQPELNSIMISLGGVDVSNVTLTLINLLSESDLPQDVQIMVVMGQAAPHIDSVRQAAASSRLHIEVKTDVSNMAELMANADLAIGAAGSTSWERCCLGLPSIQLILAENQTVIANALAGIQAIRLLNQPEMLPQIIEGIAPDLPELSRRCAAIVDGQGVDRVRDSILLGGFDISGVTFVPYTSLNREQLATVFEMRNHDTIRKWMRQTEQISWEKHLAFIKTLATKTDRLFFLARRGDDILGTVNFTNMEQVGASAELGIYANPLVSKIGQGSAIIQAALTYARSRLNLKRILLEVQEENKVAVGFYQKFGFQRAFSNPKTGFLTMEKYLANED